MTRQEVVDLAGDDELLFFDGLDDALIGLVTRFADGGHVAVACYDRKKCIETFMDQGMTHSEAEEWMSYNVEGAYIGAYTPAFLHYEES